MSDAPGRTYLTDVHIWLGWHSEWQSLNNGDSPNTDRGGRQSVCHGMFYRSHWLSVISISSHCWGPCVIYFVLVWRCRALVGEIIWVITQIWFLHGRSTQSNVFFSLLLPCPLQINLLSWNGFHVSSACQSETSLLQRDTITELSAQKCARF